MTNSLKKNLLGFSHLFGETESLDKTRAHLEKLGFVEEFSGDFDVSVSKRKNLLASPKCTKATMSYFTNKNLFPFGLEYLNHGAATKTRSARSITAFVQATSDEKIADADGNAIKLSSTLAVPTLLHVPVYDLQAPSEFLLCLGFEELSEARFGFAHPLFKKLAVEIEFELIEGFGQKTVMDEIGLNGISLLVRNLDELIEEFNLVGEQEITVPGAKDRRRVAFRARDGLMVELLEITAGKS